MVVCIDFLRCSRWLFSIYLFQVLQKTKSTLKVCGSNEKTSSSIVALLKSGNPRHHGAPGTSSESSSPRISVDSLADDVREILPKLDEIFDKTVPVLDDLRKNVIQRNDRDELSQVFVYALFYLPMI